MKEFNYKLIPGIFHQLDEINHTKLDELEEDTKLSDDEEYEKTQDWYSKENQLNIINSIIKDNGYTDEEKDLFFLYRDFFYEDFITKAIEQNIVESDVDIAAFKLGKVVIRYFENRLHGCVFRPEEFVFLLEEIKDLLKENKIEEFDSMIFGTSWDNIKVAGKRILKKHNLIEKPIITVYRKQSHGDLKLVDTSKRNHFVGR